MYSNQQSQFYKSPPSTATATPQEVRITRRCIIRTGCTARRTRRRAQTPCEPHACCQPPEPRARRAGRAPSEVVDNYIKWHARAIARVGQTTSGVLTACLSTTHNRKNTRYSGKYTKLEQLLLYGDWRGINNPKMFSTRRVVCSLVH
jgi:hypothetical protein